LRESATPGYLQKVVLSPREPRDTAGFACPLPAVERPDLISTSTETTHWSYSMKRILSILLLTFCAAVQAKSLVDHYAWGGIAYPDATSTAGLPEAIPCITKKAFNGQPMIKCTWLETSREVLIWDAQRQQDVRYVNQISGTCLRGKCRTNTTIVGEWNQD